MERVKTKMIILVVVATTSFVVASSSAIQGKLFLNDLDDWIRRLNETILEGKELNLSKGCLQGVNLLIASGKDREKWALKILDSFGKPGSGIMEGSLSFLGFYEECVESFSTDRTFHGTYCLAKVNLPRQILTELASLTMSAASSIKPKMAICLPSSCRRDEIERLASKAFSLSMTNATLTVATCSSSKKDVTQDTGAIVVIVIFVLYFLVVSSGSILDYIKNYRRSSKDGSSQEYLSSHLRLSTIEDRSVLRDCLLAFSVLENAKNILKEEQNSTRTINNNNNNFETKPSETFAVLNGLRVVMMVWIVVLHSYSFAMQWIFFRNPKDIQSAPKHIGGQFFANGTFSVDSFFFISGLLVTNSCMKQMRKSGDRLDIIKFYLHRYLRLTPLMMAIIAFSANLLKYLRDEPSFEESTIMFDSWCQKNWWLNSLYLHNFINRENMCLAHSWYSAVDMQLYLVAPIILIPLYRRPKIGFTILASALFASMTYTGFMTIAKNLPAIPYLTNIVSEESMDEYFASIYIKPYARAGPYLVGMALGFVFFSMDGKVKLTSRQSLTGWTISTIANLVILFGMVPVYEGYQLPAYLAGLYSATSRVIWALSLAWLTYACSAGRGGLVGSILSAKMWLPWSRLTYAGYLIHPIIMAVFYGSQQSTFQFSHFLMTYIVLGNLILTYVISFFLSILFESPFVALERLLPDRRRRTESNAHMLRGSHQLTN